MKGVVSPWTAATAVAVGLLSACADRIGLDPVRQPIIGGEEVSSAEFPTVVGLEFGPGDWDCTGTLIDPDWVLTAAHCVAGVAAADLAVRFDAEDLTTGTDGMAVPVEEVHAHPEWVDEIWDHDIAVLKLGARMEGRAVTPLHRRPVAAGTTVAQVGYGDSDDDGNGGGRLRMLESENVDCETTGDPEVPPGRLLCFDGRDGAATCDGDSGGPAFVDSGGRREVAGVNSGATSDLCTDSWDLNTLVAAELEYVDQFVPIADGGDDGDDGGDPGTGPEDDGDTGPGPDPGEDPEDPEDPEEPGTVGGGCSLAAGSADAGGAAAAVWLALALAWRRRRVRPPGARTGRAARWIRVG
jgi:MYXO-CTERM domain-containing protein